MPSMVTYYNNTSTWVKMAETAYNKNRFFSRHGRRGKILTHKQLSSHIHWWDKNVLDARFVVRTLPNNENIGEMSNHNEQLYWRWTICKRKPEIQSFNLFVLFFFVNAFYVVLKWVSFEWNPTSLHPLFYGLFRFYWPRFV